METSQKNYKELQQLTRERDQIVEERVMVKNQLHAEKIETEPNKGSLERMNTRIEFLNRQEQEIKTDIQEIVNQDENLLQELENICTIPGIGMLTAVIVLAETNGFELIRNKKQLTSYAGFDIREKQSGTSIRKETRISKQGNRNLLELICVIHKNETVFNDNYEQEKRASKLESLAAL